MKKTFITILSLSIIGSIHARPYSENVPMEKRDLFYSLHTHAGRIGQERLQIWMQIEDIKDSIRKSGEFPQEKTEELVDLQNKSNALTKDIRQLNSQINSLFDPEKRILELEEEEQRIKQLIVDTLKRQASSTAEEIRKSYEEVTSNDYLNHLEEDLVSIVNEKKRLKDELQKE